MDEIFPCRWCGGEAMAHGICVRIDGTPEVVAWVECEDCKAKGPTESTVADAIEVWNAGPRVEPIHVG